MPNVKVNVEADASAWTNSAIGAGLGLHLPVGQYSSADYRSAMRFPVPAGWTGWTSITKATITFFISDFQHVGPQSSAIFCSRMNVPIWSKAEGTQSCESGFAGGNTSQADDFQSVSTDRVSFTSGATANAAKTLDVTAAVRYYWGQNVKPVFVFDNNGAGEYTELWSRNKGGSYVAYLSIDYVDASPPNAPTPTGPTAGQSVLSTTPTFSWTHSDPQGDAQVNAEVRVYDAAGTTLLYTWNPSVGSTQSLVAPVALTRGTTYQYEVRTSDATGYGAYCAKTTFSIKANPVVTIDTTRYMEFAGGAPRLRVKWTVASGTQFKYRVTAGAYDSGLLTSTNQSHLLDTLALTSGTAVPITVYVETSDPLNGSAVQSFTPRYGLTTHRSNLGSVPLNWGIPSVVSTVPAGASLVIEYGSSATATATPSPNTWYPLLASVPLAQYLFWRAWFIPSATAGPTLDYLNIPTDSTASFVDKWGTTKDTPGLTGIWSVVSNEFVYGSRSVTAKVTGAGPFYCYAYKVSVKQGRSYILTGLMQSVGNSGACIELQDSAGNVLLGGGVTSPPNTAMRTEILTADRPWYTAGGRDTYRYKTPVWAATGNMDVYVVLKVGGTNGSQAWFDAIKLEESTVATPWSPGAVGATVVDAGGVQVDASKGGVFRLRGSDGAARSVVEAGVSGLKFAGDTELTSPADGVLAVDGIPIPLSVYTPPTYVEPIRRVYTASTTWTKPAGLKFIEVEVMGGGGGGGGVAAAASGTNNCGAGAGGGGYSKRNIGASILAAGAGAYVVTVGTGAAGGVAGNNAGGTGGTSSFVGTGVSMTGTGGTGGAGMPSGSGNQNSNCGLGGAGSGGDINTGGGDGINGRCVGGIAACFGTGGGSTLAGITRGPNVGNPGQTGAPYGGGGSGASGTSADVARAGGAGAPGVVIVTEYY